MMQLTPACSSSTGRLVLLLRARLAGLIDALPRLEGRIQDAGGALVGPGAVGALVHLLVELVRTASC
jgi:hypothetical protein